MQEELDRHPTWNELRGARRPVGSLKRLDAFMGLREITRIAEVQSSPRPVGLRKSGLDEHGPRAFLDVSYGLFHHAVGVADVRGGGRVDDVESSTRGTNLNGLRAADPLKASMA